MLYRTYTVAITCRDCLKYFDIVACDMEAAHADVRATYGNEVDIVFTQVQ